MRDPRERRLVLRLLGYWRGLCGDDDLPCAADVDGAAIADMWDYCFMIDVASGIPKFTHFGDWHASFYGSDMSDKALADLDKDTLAARSTNYLDEVLRRKIPMTYGNSLTEPNGRKILYRSILMPLSDGGEAPTSVLGGSNCKIATAADGV